MRSRSLPGFVFAALILVLLPRAWGQHVLLAEYKKQLHPVRAAHGARPYIEVDGKRVAAAGDRFALKEVAEYLPLFIAVRNINVRTTGIQFTDSTGTINNQFELRADFTASYALEDVFLVLELDFGDGKKSLFLHEVGTLRPRRPQPLSLAVRTSYPLGSGQYKLHLFVGGMEVLHSQQPFNYRESILDQLVAKRSAGRTDAKPELFVGPPPEYPRKLEKTKTKGQVRMKFRILPTGAVVDPVVLEASDPAFGESALAAVRLWRFLPRMRDGHPVTSDVVIPIEFDPPEPAGKS